MSGGRPSLEAAVTAAAQNGITLRRFVFSRNQVCHLNVFKNFGLTAYGGTEPQPCRRLSTFWVSFLDFDPGEYRVHGLSTKLILKRAVRELVRDIVLLIPNYGFAVPTEPGESARARRNGGADSY